MRLNESFDIKQAFENYLDFWIQRMLTEKKIGIFPEISIENIPNDQAAMGSMYLARVLYGSAKACQFEDTEGKRILANKAYTLLKGFKNPEGGYFWARNHEGAWIHDPENVNMGQAFVLYGLATFAQLDGSREIEALMEEQVTFIESVLKQGDDPYYLDGFGHHWKRSGAMTRSFATHFHTMEALVQVYLYKKDENLRRTIRDLLHVIIDRFIDKTAYCCIHRFTETWEALPNENWAGHNAECSWVICDAAKRIADPDLIARTEELAILMMEQVIENAKDSRFGGYDNLILDKGLPLEQKSWWPQAEIVLGFINAYHITKNKSYQKLAEEQIRYIQKFFVNESGEWYAEVNRTGQPVESIPQVFFWKSMYHTVRYYAYLMANLDLLAKKKSRN